MSLEATSPLRHTETDNGCLKSRQSLAKVSWYPVTCPESNMASNPCDKQQSNWWSPFKRVERVCFDVNLKFLCFDMFLPETLDRVWLMNIHEFLVMWHSGWLRHTQNDVVIYYSELLFFFCCISSYFNSRFRVVQLSDVKFWHWSFHWFILSVSLSNFCGTVPTSTVHTNNLM